MAQRPEAVMERREFFRLGARKTAEIAYRLAGEAAARRAANWLRPPFAVDELDFLLACTRCDKCIEACPHDVLFRLPARLGPQAAGTPAMDLLNRGCHLCRDWPCVAACEPDALKLPDHGEGGAPARAILAHVEIDRDTCLPYAGPECGACAHACPVPGALQWEAGIRPVINQESCTGCALCREACIVDPKAVTVSAFVADEETSEVP
jgi:ferredoxin-type protein NapG